jgi:DNA polymerase
MIIPRPGHTFIISDLSQIEQRVLSWLAGDNDMMTELEKGISVYEAHARATMGYSDPEPLKHNNPDLYRLAKARVLGLGYGAGAAVFVRIAKTMAGLDITQHQAQQIVPAFRSSNKHITQLWAKLEQAFAVNMGKACFALPLPSGRKMYYRNLAMTPKGMSAEVQGKRFSFFGGKLTENLTSATARDVLGEILLNLDAAGYRVVMHIHDEVVVEVPTTDVDNALIDIHRIMTTAPEWLEGLPLAAETTTSTFYTK